MCVRANERENERELQLIRAASQIFFFFSFFFFLFSFFFARRRARALRRIHPTHENAPPKFFLRFAHCDCVFRSIRQMQTAKKEEPGKKKFALRALCLRLLLHPAKMRRRVFFSLFSFFFAWRRARALRRIHPTHENARKISFFALRAL